MTPDWQGDDRVIVRSPRQSAPRDQPVSRIRNPASMASGGTRPGPAIASASVASWPTRIRAEFACCARVALTSSTMRRVNRQIEPQMSRCADHPTVT